MSMSMQIWKLVTQSPEIKNSRSNPTQPNPTHGWPCLTHGAL